MRLGTADFYRAMETVPEVGDSLVVHLEDPEGGAGRLLLFVTVPDGILDDALVARIRAVLRGGLSPRHVPDGVLQVPAIPYNRTGKKLEVPVKRILQGHSIDESASRESLADPTSLDAFAAIAQDRIAWLVEVVVGAAISRHRCDSSRPPTRYRVDRRKRVR